mmetsp:Transcript_25277/g.39848  ORF Transcript_25277/g.39848 Transcript_25277/m.39848 type:complete len:158 (+) Transcript_25277:37-510(+)
MKCSRAALGAILGFISASASPDTIQDNGDDIAVQTVTSNSAYLRARVERAQGNFFQDVRIADDEEEGEGGSMEEMKRLRNQGVDASCYWEVNCKEELWCDCGRGNCNGKWGRCKEPLGYGYVGCQWSKQCPYEDGLPTCNTWSGLCWESNGEGVTVF